MYKDLFSNYLLRKKKDALYFPHSLVISSFIGNLIVFRIHPFVPLVCVVSELIFHGGWSPEFLAHLNTQKVLRKYGRLNEGRPHKLTHLNMVTKWVQVKRIFSCVVHYNMMSIVTNNRELQKNGWALTRKTSFIVCSCVFYLFWILMWLSLC